MGTRDPEELLEGLGLTNRQARVYLAVCSLGEGVTQAIAKMARVPQQDVYRIIRDLEAKGLVFKVVDSPNRFRALPLETGFSNLLKVKTDETSKLVAESREFVKSYHKQPPKTPSLEESIFMLCPTQAQTQFSGDKLLRESKNFLWMLLSWKNVVRLMSGPVWEIHCEAAKRGVKQRIITEKVKNCQTTLKSVLLNPNFEIRFISGPILTIFLLVDGKTIIVSADIEAHVSASPNLFTDSPGVVKIFQEYHETMWEKASVD